ncbi:hypothetical protein RhiirA4_477950 [Rhizophagus irregularis]|uniref:Uncharacterized protein n=1 Tax=Rhizophagus irregularis TaxID=588596 RepID=A0A2I1HE05_9GLOM|nr:hypothetical protein RhiirA4_477950 [Rhizophagus irregularis]
MRGELTQFHLFRYLLYLIVIIAYLLYLCYLIYNIVYDKPNLKVDQIFLNEVDVPDIAICGTQELKILRCDLKANHVIKEQIDGCTNYILPNAADYGVFKNHCLTFKANKTIKFTKPDSDIAGYDQIGFSFYDNTTAAEAGTIGIASLTILIIPPDFNPATNPNKAISQMDKATLSELKLQLNFIAGMARYAAVVKFKTSTYRSILPGDSLGTTGYFSIAAGSFIQEQTSEERSNTVLGAIAAAGGASGTTAAILIFFFGDFRLKPRGFAHTFHNYIQNPLSFIKRSRFYSEPELKFSGKDKKVLEDEFEKIRHAIYHHLLYQGNMDSKMNKDQKWSINRLGNKINILFNHLILDAENIKKEFEKYDNDRNRLEFSSINEEDKRLLNDEIDKIRHVIDVYTLGKKEDPKKIAAYKYERELKFSNNTTNELHLISDDDQKSLNDEFRKIRELIDNHLLDQPNIEKIFNAYNSLRKNVFPIDIKDIDEGNTLQNNNLPVDMDVDKKLLNDVFHQISHVIFRHLLDIPEDEILFNKYKETVETSSFSTEMNDNDKKLLVNEFNRIKHVINSHLFNGRKILKTFKEYREKRVLKFSNINEEDEKLLNDKFHKIRNIIDSFLLNETETYLRFSDNMDEEDSKLLNDVLYNIRNDIDNYILNKV